MKTANQRNAGALAFLLFTVAGAPTGFTQEGVDWKFYGAYLCRSLRPFALFDSLILVVAGCRLI